ncbi:MAG: tRNA lysidine(34) synthetase TilS [Candidatus Nanopelagicales bacterium]
MTGGVTGGADPDAAERPASDRAGSEVLAVRTALRAALADLPPGSLVLVACSGGADSLALAAATARVAPRAGLRAGAVVVDHGLQPDSAQVAAGAAAACRDLGLDPVRVEAVAVDVRPGSGGPEAAARDARRQALDRAADDLGAAAVLLAHTRDDQAETVLLRLARGSGARSLAGMAERDGRWRRPLLRLPRDLVRAAAAEQGLRPWQDPHNEDPRYARVRVRSEALPALTGALGPGVPEALARTAALLREDADALDGYADEAYERLATVEAPAGSGRDRGDATLSLPVVSLPVDGLAALPAAVRARVLLRAARAAGCPAGRLTADHVTGLRALVESWHGQGEAALPGGVRAARACGRLTLRGTAP